MCGFGIPQDILVERISNLYIVQAEGTTLTSVLWYLVHKLPKCQRLAFVPSHKLKDSKNAGLIFGKTKLNSPRGHHTWSETSGMLKKKN